MTRTGRTWLVSGLAAFAVVIILALVRAGVADSGAIPADVLARSDIARAHMKQIAQALYNYAMENQDRLPPDLRMLYPDYVSDPAVFWHPGDSDPKPTTIDNNVPNQPNSTRISFEFASAASPGAWGGCDPLVWDNSAANNGGLFVNKVFGYGSWVSTDPPFATPSPTRRDVAQRNLKSLATALYTYATSNNDDFPTDLVQLMNDGSVCSPSTFWNPGDSDPEPTAITNSVPNALNSSQISYAYFGGKTDYVGAVVMMDNSLENNNGEGVFAITDGAAVFLERSGRSLPSSATARANLHQIGIALHVYATDNNDYFPTKLSMLYPHYITEPAVFWNPGDRNPQPTTIDKDTPNQINSAQISYNYLGAGYRSDCPAGVILVADNSLTNNGGTGINILTADTVADYFAITPPSCQHPPACTAIAASNLRSLGVVLSHYAEANMGWFPERLSLLSPHYIANPTLFWNPGDSDSYPLTIDNDVLNQLNSSQISFEYLGTGHRNTDDPRTLIMRDNTPANNAGRGILALYADTHVDFLPSVTLTSIAIASGPATVSEAGFANYTCMATYSDGTTWDVTAYADWSVTSGPGAAAVGTYAAPLVLPADTPATIHVAYTDVGNVTRQADKSITVTAVGRPGDFDHDGDVDQADFGWFQACLSGEAVPQDDPACQPAKLDGDGDVDQADFGMFQHCLSGPDVLVDPDCAD
jgi:hypothetical protein